MPRRTARRESSSSVREQRSGQLHSDSSAALGQTPGGQAPTPAGTSLAHAGLAQSRRVVAMAVVVLVVLATAGVVAARWVRSPQQVAADAAAPARTVLTAAVTSQVVAESVVLRGTVGASTPVTIPMPAPSAAGGEATGASRQIISATPVAPGTQVQAGQVAVEISGRPVIVLPGAVPAYRDLHPGDSGPDVTQLQNALKAIGLYSGTADGAYGAGTKDAVRKLYERVGYQVPSTTGLGDPPDPAVTAAKAALDQANAALAQAQAGSAGGSGAAQSSAGATPTGPSSDPTAVQQAQQAVAAAQQAYDTAAAKSGPMVPMAEVAFLPTLPARLVSLGAGIGGTPKETLATFDTGSPVVVSQADPGQVTGLRTGMGAKLADSATGVSASATITVIGQVTTDSSGAQQVAVTLTPSAPLPDAEMGADLQVTVDQASSNGKVLAVPIAAITSKADGSTYVTRRDGDGAQTQVAVTTGVVGQGMVQVTPTGGRALKAGDEVVTSQ